MSLYQSKIKMVSLSVAAVLGCGLAVSAFAKSSDPCGDALIEVKNRSAVNMVVTDIVPDEGTIQPNAIGTVIMPYSQKNWKVGQTSDKGNFFGKIYVNAQGATTTAAELEYIFHKGPFNSCWVSSRKEQGQSVKVEESHDKHVITYKLTLQSAKK